MRRSVIHPQSEGPAAKKPKFKRCRKVYLVYITLKDRQGNPYDAPFVTVVFNKKGEWIKDAWQITNLVPELLNKPVEYQIFVRNILYLRGRRPYSLQWG